MNLAFVPPTIVIDGKSHTVIDTMENIHSRALVLPPLGSPRWLSNDDVLKYTAVKGTEDDEDVWPEEDGNSVHDPF